MINLLLLLDEYITTFTIYIPNILYNQIYESVWWCCKNPLDIPDQLSELTSSLSSANRIGTAGHWTRESRVLASSRMAAPIETNKKTAISYE